MWYRYWFCKSSYISIFYANFRLSFDTHIDFKNRLHFLFVFFLFLAEVFIYCWATHHTLHLTITFSTFCWKILNSDFFQLISPFQIFFALQIYRCDTTNKICQASEQSTCLLNHCHGVGDISSHWFSHSLRSQQYTGSWSQSLYVLQYGFYSLLIAKLILYTLHNNGVFVLEHIHGE